MAEDPGEACPPLAGAVSADVCVVGGGLLGLWTALEVREQAPDASVVLIEGEACGFGASGRNGGWMTSWWDELDALEARFGAADARWLAARSSEAIDRVAQVTEAEGIDCELRRGGALMRGDRARPSSRACPPRPKAPGAAGRRRRAAAAHRRGRRARGRRALRRGGRASGAAGARAAPPRPAPRRADLRGHADASLERGRAAAGDRERRPRRGRRAS